MEDLLRKREAGGCLTEYNDALGVMTKVKLGVHKGEKGDIDE